LAKIKHTKNELKAQREALSRFERFLPMLQLKKKQLQVEIQGIDHALDENSAKTTTLRDDIAAWVGLFSEPVGLDQIVVLEAVETREGNIAGVAIPILEDIKMRRSEYDLFLSPPWVDDAVERTEQLIRLHVEGDILAEQRRLIEDELRVTNQRVNLFEKVKIPECKEHIRVIRIFLGEEQTAAVARGKLAKSRN
jgi:V/A-type H+-transporting ATPase subunit D